MPDRSIEMEVFRIIRRHGASCQFVGSQSLEQTFQLILDITPDASEDVISGYFCDLLSEEILGRWIRNGWPRPTERQLVSKHPNLRERILRSYRCLHENLKARDKVGPYTVVKVFREEEEWTFLALVVDDNGEKLFAKACKSSHRQAPQIRNEFNCLRRLEASGRHPNLIRCFGSNARDAPSGSQSREETHTYILLEYLGSNTLKDVYSKLSVAELSGVGMQLASGLRHVHDASWLHCDISPDNLFITKSGVAKIGDFGVAIDGNNGNQTRKRRSSDGRTDRFASPEQLLDKQLDERSDIYSLGASLAYCILGADLYTRNGFRDEVEQRRNKQRLLSGRRRLLDAIVQATNTKPEERFQSAEQFRNALKPSYWRTEQSIKLAATFAVLLCVSLFILELASRPSRETVASKNETIATQNSTIVFQENRLIYLFELLSAANQRSQRYENTLGRIRDDANFIREMHPSNPELNRLARRILEYYEGHSDNDYSEQRMQQSRYARAIAEFATRNYDKVIELTSQDNVKGLLLQGNAYAGQKKWLKAAECYRGARIVSIDERQRYLASSKELRCFSILGDLKQKLRALNEFVEQASDPLLKAVFLTQKSELHVDEGDIPSAMVAVKKAREKINSSDEGEKSLLNKAEVRFRVSRQLANTLQMLGRADLSVEFLAQEISHLKSENATSYTETRIQYFQLQQVACLVQNRQFSDAIERSNHLIDNDNVFEIKRSDQPEFISIKSHNLAELLMWKSMAQSKLGYDGDELLSLDMAIKSCRIALNAMSTSNQSFRTTTLLSNLEANRIRILATIRPTDAIDAFGKFLSRSKINELRYGEGNQRQTRRSKVVRFPPGPEMIGRIRRIGKTAVFYNDCSTDDVASLLFLFILQKVFEDGSPNSYVDRLVETVKHSGCKVDLTSQPALASILLGKMDAANEIGITSRIKRRARKAATIFNMDFGELLRLIALSSKSRAMQILVNYPLTDEYELAYSQAWTELTLELSMFAIEQNVSHSSLNQCQVFCLNNIAFYLATTTDPQKRDANRSVQLAKKACELSGYSEELIVDTLAAAHEAAGNPGLARKYRQMVDSFVPRLDNSNIELIPVLDFPLKIARNKSL